MRVLIKWTGSLVVLGTQPGPGEDHCEYTFLEAEGKVQREYWENCDPENRVMQLKRPLPGKYISDIKFSRHVVDGGDSYIQTVITSSPEYRTETAERTTYCIGMHPIEDPIQ